MINKIVTKVEEAVADIKDGDTVMLGGFGHTGVPFNLVQALLDQGTRQLTVICNAVSQGAPLIENRRISKLIASFPMWVVRSQTNPLDEQYVAGEIIVEMVPQGTLAERIRAGGAGVAAFYTPTGVGTILEEGKEKRVIDGKEHLLEWALKADVALVKAYKGDRMGNLVYHTTARNYNPIMATAAKLTIAEVEEIVDVGQLDPETIVTPGIFVDRVIKVPKRSHW